MSTYLWTMVVLCAISIGGRVYRLARSDFSTSPREVSMNLAADIGLLVWSAVLLFGGQ